MVGQAVDLAPLKRRLDGIEDRIDALEAQPAADSFGPNNYMTIDAEGVVTEPQTELPIESQGDLITGDASGGVDVLPVGAEGQVLTVAPEAPDGITWADFPEAESVPQGPWVEEGITGTGGGGHRERPVTPPIGARALVVMCISPSGDVARELKYNGIAMAALGGVISGEGITNRQYLIDNVGSASGELSWTESAVSSHLQLFWILASTEVKSNGTGSNFGRKAELLFTISAASIEKVGFALGFVARYGDASPYRRSGNVLSIIDLASTAVSPYEVVRVEFWAQPITEANNLEGLPCFATFLSELPPIGITGRFVMLGLRVA